VTEMIRKTGIPEQTLYRRKKQYASVEVDQVRELKQWQEENDRLKWLVADLTRGKTIMRAGLTGLLERRRPRNLPVRLWSAVT
jgi:putative transposase